jgi:hypothetical protein
MTERFPLPHFGEQPVPEPAGSSWDIPGIGNSLNAEPEKVWTIEHGDGWYFPFGADQETRMALYPETEGDNPFLGSTAYIHSGDVSVHLRHLKPPQLKTREVLFTWLEDQCQSPRHVDHTEQDQPRGSQPSLFFQRHPYCS